MAKIFVDAGHDYKGSNTGATDNGLEEKYYTVIIANYVGKILTQNGHAVKYSRPNYEDTISENTDESLEKRCTMAREWGPDVAVSVHLNSAGFSARGFEVWWCHDNPESEDYAKLVVEEYKTANPKLINRGAKKGTPQTHSDWRLTRKDKMGCPAVLVETLFLSDSSDVEYLKQELNQHDIARGIANGIIQYLRSINKDSPTIDPNSAAAGGTPINVQSGSLHTEPSYTMLPEDKPEPVEEIDTSYLTSPFVAGSVDAGYMEALPRIYDKQLSIRCDYLIYFDDVLMNKYVLNYSCSTGTSAGMGRATVTILYAPSFRSVKVGDSVEDGIENGTQLRIFANNIFSRKYKLIFDGIIKQRTFVRDASGHKLSFSAIDYMYWMNKIIAPISIPFNDAVSPGERLKWKAQSVDPDTTAKVEISQAGSLKGKTLTEYFETLKEKSFTNSKIYSEENSVANWDDVINRVKIMGDINERLVKDEVIDFVINSNSVFADTVYVSLSNTTQALLMEMYQDRDGIVRIKPPFWNEPVLKNHIIDPMMILSARESTDWNKYYTRVIVTGGVEEWMDSDTDTSQKIDLLTPVGVYLGSLTDKSKAQWADYTSEGSMPSSFGPAYREMEGTMSTTTGGGIIVPGAAGTGDFSNWMYPLGKEQKYPIPGAARHFGAGRKNGRIHAGVDLVQAHGTPVYACTSGEVVDINRNFYLATHAVAFKCDDGHWINFAEINPCVSIGDKVPKGGKIGEIMRAHAGQEDPMLHFEVYKGDFTGSSALYGNYTPVGQYLHVEQKNYCRRMDLLDPTFVADLPRAVTT